MGCSLSRSVRFDWFYTCRIDRCPIGVGGFAIVFAAAVFGGSGELGELGFIEDCVCDEPHGESLGKFVLELFEVAEDGADGQSGGEDGVFGEGYVLLDEAVLLGGAEVAEGGGEAAFVVAPVFGEALEAFLEFGIFGGLHEVGEGAIFGGLGLVETPG